MPKPNRTLRRWLASWSRWLHIYSSLFGLAVILFFSVTGFTLNHPDWFFKEHSIQRQGQLELDWLHQSAQPPENWDQYDYSHEIDKLRVAEFLRGEHSLHGTVTDFLAFENECELTFQGPGYAATARVDRGTGKYQVDLTQNDLVTVMNDLHKGRHTGQAWSWLIDASAIIGTFAAISGFVLIFFLRLRRRTGIIVSIVGSIVLVAFVIYVRQ